MSSTISRSDPKESDLYNNIYIGVFLDGNLSSLKVYLIYFPNLKFFPPAIMSRAALIIIGNTFFLSYN
jgi:hypothetical protein